jgi:hypothetical protein
MSDSVPPPPSNLTPPPGYAAYQASEFALGGIRRIRGLSLAIVALMAVYALASLISLAVVGSVKDASEDFLANRITTEEFDDKLGAYGFGGLLSVVGLLAGIVVSMIWLYRIVSNHRAIGRAVFWAPLWAIFGWFLPPFLFIIPFLLLIETWKAADPQSRPGTDGWKRGGIPPVLIIWFAIFGVARTAATFLTGSPFDQLSRDRDKLANRFVDHAAGVSIQAAVEVLGAIAWGAVVWSLTKRHTELTGEARAR